MNILEPHLVRFIMVNIMKLMFSSHVIANVYNLDPSHMVRRCRDTAAEEGMQDKEPKRLTEKKEELMYCCDKDIVVVF